MAITPSVIFISLTGIILFLIIIVAIMERFVSKRKQDALESPAYAYTADLKELKRASLEPQELLNRIDLLARKTFGSELVGGHLDYSQIAESHKDKPHVTQFCTAMTESLYTGEKITPIQIKSLLHALEDMLKGEGKIILIQPKTEILEAKTGFFLDKLVEDAALKINAKLKEVKEKKEIEQKEKDKVQKTEEKIEKKKDDPVFKKERLIIKAKMDKKDEDRKEYNFIESIDVLDRIESKLSAKKNISNASN